MVMFILASPHPLVPAAQGDPMNHTQRLLRATFLAVVCALAAPASGQAIRYEIHFPTPPGYQTLACDLHMHTVFSDGLVWPTVRVSRRPGDKDSM